MAYLADFHILIIIASVFSVLYYTYIAIEQNAFVFLIKYFQRGIDVIMKQSSSKRFTVTLNSLKMKKQRYH
jgi:hypothetical protein